MISRLFVILCSPYPASPAIFDRAAIKPATSRLFVIISKPYPTMQIISSYEVFEKIRKPQIVFLGYLWSSASQLSPNPNFFPCSIRSRNPEVLIIRSLIFEIYSPQI